jgi:hypothetical protein
LTWRRNTWFSPQIQFSSRTGCGGHRVDDQGAGLADIDGMADDPAGEAVPHCMNGVDHLQQLGVALLAR